ncbi:MAG: DUF3656 domain-containing protein [Rhodocyclaceae bacterium]
MANDSAERRIRVDAHLSETPDGFVFTLTDEDGIRASATASLRKQPAQQPEKAVAHLRALMARLGGTNFALRDFEFDCRACEMHVVGRIEPHILAGALT